jgi:hypothetical protein
VIVSELQATSESKEKKVAAEVQSAASYIPKNNGRRNSLEEASDLSEQEDDIEGRDKESTVTRSSRGNVNRDDRIESTECKSKRTSF